MLPLAFLILAAAPRSVAEAEDKAQQALTAGKPAEALRWFEEGIRRASGMATQLRLRDAYLGVGWTPPRPQGPRERAAVAAAVQEEKLRLWRKAAEDFEGTGRLHAALLVRRRVLELVGEG
ncbi:MAG: hypothetical protein ACE5JG_12865, partial [Planctomycetota bacterium]